MFWSTAIVAATGGLVLGVATCSLRNPGEKGSPATLPTPLPESVAPEGFAILPPSAVRLAGQATIGSWSSVSQQVQGEMLPGVEPAAVHAWFDRGEPVFRSDDSSRSIEIPLSEPLSPLVQLRVPVGSLECDSAGMKKDMLTALKADQHPLIEYHLVAVHAAEWVLPQEDSPARPYVRLTTVGELTLAGERRPIEMDVIARRLDDRRFSLIGRKELKMTDFNITPPSALFGLIRAGNDVVVVFDLVIGEHSNPDQAP